MNIFAEIALGAVKGTLGTFTGPFGELGMDILQEVIDYNLSTDSSTPEWANQYYAKTTSKKKFTVTQILDYFSKEQLIPIADLLSNNGEKWNTDKTSKETVLLSIKNNIAQLELEQFIMKLIWEGMRGELEESEGVSTEESSKFYKGVSLFFKGRFSEAIPYFSELLEVNPHFKMAYFHRGTAYSELERYDLALNDFNKILELDPNNVLAYMNRGLLYLLNGWYGLAVYNLDRALDGDPDNIAALHNRKLAYSAILEPPVKSPNVPAQPETQLTPEELCKRGNQKLHNNDIDGALEDYYQAICLDPKFSMAYAARGYLKESKSNDIDGAINDYTIALTLTADDVTTRCFRGNLLRGKGDFNGALKDFNKTIEIAPNWAFGYVSRGFLLLYKIGKTKEAIADFDKALTLNPQDSTTYNYRGDAKKHLGDAEGAQADYAKADSLVSESGV